MTAPVARDRHSHTSGAGHPRAEQGLALVVALFFSVIVAGLTMTGAMLMKAHVQKTRTAWASKNQAMQIARSGLNEGLVWLRRQTSQPVLGFAPQFDDTVDPPVLDTIDEDIGLVREFRITDRLWARYEVWKRWDADPSPSRLIKRRLYQCEDISASRAGSSPGTVWRLRSVGYIFNQLDDTVPFNVAPNRVVASHVASNEVRRLVIHLPGQAAINVADPNSCHINTNGRINGGTGLGITYPSGASGAPTMGPPSPPRVTGSPQAHAGTIGYDDSYEGVFSVSYAQLLALATLVVTDPAGIPSPMPAGGLIIIDCGTVQFDAARPLLGTAIVIVRGNTTIANGSNSNFTGMLYVDGNLTVRAPSEINGSVVCTGNVNVQGVPDYATINFDPDALDALTRDLGNYRISNTTYLPRVSR